MRSAAARWRWACATRRWRRRCPRRRTFRKRSAGTAMPASASGWRPSPARSGIGHGSSCPPARRPRRPPSIRRSPRMRRRSWRSSPPTSPPKRTRTRPAGRPSAMPEAHTPPAPPRLRPLGPIVRAADLGIWGEAGAALSAARRHADETRAWAEDLVDRERERGFAEGRAAGAEATARLLAETSARAAAHLARLERELPALVGGLVADILGQFEPGDALARSVAHAVGRLAPDAGASLRVAPGDLESVRAALGEASPVQVEADPAMRPGECCLRSPVGSVELGIEAQLRALRTGLAAAAEGAGS
ncbi:MAG: HrpE/YscL family type III secretion apparatus protein [Methylobacterium sp. CG08_land_8_20_14_0_20_71_15]|nr:MAG: HrpE/YscL family type III secretion apparatus protein [Methylobacterium sp. CG09_land_8_20_14_0_10_71_15]PIU13626.1 MAG: HrpE/YscL family type III secretion apparatus protein [Methylobacterium sp. CG08_land_8_20_14_0_20_71_15]